MRIVVVPVFIGPKGIAESAYPKLGVEIAQAAATALKAAAPPVVEKAAEQPAAAPEPAPLLETARPWTVSEFIASRCQVGRRHYVCVGTLNWAYQEWCIQHNSPARSAYLFSEELMKRGFTQCRGRRIDGRQCRTWEGIGLVGDNPPQAPPRRYERERVAVPSERSAIQDIRAKLRELMAAVEGVA